MLKEKRVLVIDDDINLAQTLKDILNEEGFCFVDLACNGKEGVQLHKQMSYSLIITDIDMPVMNGLEVVKWVKQNSPSTKLMVISGGGHINTKDSLTDAKELGAHAVLQKPFDNLALVGIIENLLANEDL
jgi:DNA-binding NtrC family response regulator